MEQFALQKPHNYIYQLFGALKSPFLLIWTFLISFRVTENKFQKNNFCNVDHFITPFSTLGRNLQWTSTSSYFVSSHLETRESHRAHPSTCTHPEYQGANLGFLFIQRTGCIIQVHPCPGWKMWSRVHTDLVEGQGRGKRIGRAITEARVKIVISTEEPHLQKRR